MVGIRGQSECRRSADPSTSLGMTTGADPSTSLGICTSSGLVVRRHALSLPQKTSSRAGREVFFCMNTQLPISRVVNLIADESQLLWSIDATAARRRLLEG